MHNFASPGSNPAVSSNDPIPYAVEVHDTRYQYGFAATPEHLGRGGMNDKDVLKPKEKKERVKNILEGVLNLRRVGGNHARYLTDFSPEVLVLRWTDDPVPRLLYCFGQDEHGAITLSSLITKIEGADIEAGEVIIGAGISLDDCSLLENLGVKVFHGVKKAVESLLEQINEKDLSPKK